MLSRRNPPGTSPPTGKYRWFRRRNGRHLGLVGRADGKKVGGTITEDSTIQTRDAFLNLRTLMESLDSNPLDVDCLRTYLTPGAAEGFYRERDQVSSEWCPDRDYPVNTLVIISGLADSRAMVEIEAVLALHPQE